MNPLYHHFQGSCLGSSGWRVVCGRQSANQQGKLSKSRTLPNCQTLQFLNSSKLHSSENICDFHVFRQAHAVLEVPMLAIADNCIWNLGSSHKSLILKVHIFERLWGSFMDQYRNRNHAHKLRWQNKLASLKATLVWNYDSLTYSLTDKGKV